MTWRPLTGIPDPIQLAFLDAARATVMPLDTHAGISRGENDTLAVDLADGRRIHVAFKTIAQSPATFGARNALRYDMEGRAVVGTEGLGLAASAIVDIKTRAFLDVSCQIRWRDNQG